MENKKLSYRSAGRAAIASGIIGIFAFGFLITAVLTRTSMEITAPVSFMFRAHDVAIIFQFLLIIPVAFALHKFSMQLHSGMSRTTLAVGIGALSFTVLFLLLVFVNILADTLYMFPQGIFGVWLMVICWRMHGILSQGLRWFGIVVGFGLALVGTFPIGYILFVDTILLKIPAQDLTNYPEHTNLANQIIHRILDIGSLMGVITLPIWSILLGRKFLKIDSSTNA